MMMSDFQSVWNRVTGGETEPEETVLLQELISRKKNDIAIYHMALQKTGLTCFGQLEREEQEQCRALQTHYYLLAGDSAVCGQINPAIPKGMMRTLRTCYQQELESSERFHAYSKRFSTNTLQLLCLELAKQETEHANLLWSLAKRYL